MGLGNELAQAFLPRFTFDPWDVVAAGLGSLIGIALVGPDVERKGASPRAR